MRPATNQSGAKTPEGKARSSLNAVKHGRYAKTLPPGIDDLSEATAFKAARQKLIAEYKPEGELENFAILQLAMCFIRQARLWRLESGLHDALARAVEREDGQQASELPIKPSDLEKQAASLQKELDAAVKRLNDSQAKRRALASSAAMPARREARF